MIKTTACCSTDTGVVRKNNEDICFTDSDKGIFLVADGMGGEAAGEEASRIFKNTVIEYFSNDQRDRGESVTATVKDCFQKANKKILQHIDANPDHSGMGCTGELLLIDDGAVTIGHVGDSRVYCFNEGQLRQLTDDHTFIQEQLNQGLISIEGARKHPMKNLILRVVGSNEQLDVDTFQKEAEVGEIYLLCTDGLTDMVSDEEIKKVLMYDFPLDLKATMLIDLAVEGGGKDNVTVVLIGVE